MAESTLWQISTLGLILLGILEIVHRLYWTRAQKQATDERIKAKDEEIKRKDDEINQLRAKSIWEDTKAITEARDARVRLLEEQLGEVNEKLKAAKEELERRNS